MESLSPLNRALLLSVIVALLQSANALQCWKCSSDRDLTCRDTFNVTNIRRNAMNTNNFYGNGQVQAAKSEPQLTNCDDNFQRVFGQKIVCLKRVNKGPNKVLPEVHRECRMVPSTFTVGECPEELKNKNDYLDYCGTCETDGCNSATNLKTNFIIMASLVPLSIMLFFKK